MNYESLHSLLINGDCESFYQDFYAHSELELSDSQAKELLFLGFALNKNFHCYSVLDRVRSIPDADAYKPVEEFVYRGCCDPPNRAASYGLSLPPRKNPTTSIVEHKRHTSSSIYVSCSKSISIAHEFAVSVSSRLRARSFIYKIKSNGAIDCQKWFSPAREFHSAEQEVLFPYHIPPELLVAYSEPCMPPDFQQLPLGG